MRSSVAVDGVTAVTGNGPSHGNLECKPPGMETLAEDNQAESHTW